MRIALFATCLADAMFPQAAIATVTLLERLGHEVVFPPEQTCCGQMHINTGYLVEATDLVRNHVEVFENAGCDYAVAPSGSCVGSVRPAQPSSQVVFPPEQTCCGQMHVNTGYLVEATDLVRNHVEVFENAGCGYAVAPSGSCVGSVRHQHAMVARRAGDEDLARRAEAIASRTYELSEFLVDVLDVRDVGAYYPHRVTYHPTCHSLRMLRVGDKPLDLLRHVRGMTLVELSSADSCCGFGGTFAVKNADTSTAMLADKMTQRHRVRRRGVQRRRLVVFDAHRRRTEPDPLRRAHSAPRGDPRRDRTGGGVSMTTFLGVPGRGNLRGTESFPRAARRALTDTQMRRNVGHATRTIRTKRLAVVSECEDWEQLRLAGSALKQDVMSRLPELLEQLEANVVARGGVVHWARDADEANRIVTDLIRATGSDEVVKVKSMATQEIGLNEHLESEGIAAIETDLAELIVQLGHDKPSHILVPAIHRNRAEIREIFMREMPEAGALTDEPHVLAMAARAHLRRKFLTAQVAVSGANFGVADTGTLAVVESEGNGRMCLTLPQTLITVMGIEKAGTQLHRPRGVHAVAAAFIDGRAHEPLHLDVDRGARRRRPPRVPSGAARQRPHQSPRRRGRPRCAALHSVQRLPQRVPGVRTHRRPRVRLGLPGSDRRDPEPATHRHPRPW